MKTYIIISCILFSIVCKAQNNVPGGAAVNPDNYPYPFAVTYFEFQTQGKGLKMAYMDVNPEKPNGSIVLLLHGKNFCGAYWQKTSRALVEIGYRVIIPDQVGFGKSTKPAQMQYSFHLLASYTKLLLDEAGIKKVIVLGHSMGGMLAARFALMYPDMTEKLILENPIGLEDWRINVPYHPVELQYKKELSQNYETIKKYQEENYYHGTWKPEYGVWVYLLSGWSKSPDYPIIAWNAALTYDMIYTQPVLYELKNITCPTLFIIGELDRTALGKDLVDERTAKTLGNHPVLAKEAAMQIKKSRLVFIPGTGHIPHIESFDTFIHIVITFLENKKS